MPTQSFIPLNANTHLLTACGVPLVEQLPEVTQVVSALPTEATHTLQTNLSSVTVNRLPRNTQAWTVSIKGGYDLTIAPETAKLYTFCPDSGIAFRSPKDIAALRGNRPVHVALMHHHPYWRNRKPLSVTTMTSSVRERRRFKRAKLIHAAFKKLGRDIYGIARLVGASYMTVAVELLRPCTLRPIPFAIDTDLAYLLGLLVGDGAMSPKMIRRNDVRYYSNDPPLIDAVRATVVRLFGANIAYFGNYAYACRAPLLSGLLLDLNMANAAHDKQIPAIILASPKPVARAFLQGLFDTDGTSTKNGRVAFCSCSRTLASQVQQSLLSFGLVSTRHFKTKNRAWIIDLSGSAHEFYDRIGFRLPRKQERRRLLSKSRYGDWHQTPVGGRGLSKSARNRWTFQGQLQWRAVTDIETQPSATQLFHVSTLDNVPLIANGFIVKGDQ